MTRVDLLSFRVGEFVKDGRHKRGQEAIRMSRKTEACYGTLLSPLRGLLISHFCPTACAVGCILSPLRG